MTSAAATAGLTADDSSTGDTAWTNPTYAEGACDSVYADALVSRPKSSNSCISNVLHYLKASTFGFAIPAGSTINGIQVDIKRYASYNTVCVNGNGTGYYVDTGVYLTKAGTYTGSNYADTGTKWPTSNTNKTYGGPTDLWGTTWTPADINASGFGVGINATVLASSDSSTTWYFYAYIDCFTITVTYTLGGKMFVVKNVIGL